MNTDSAAHANYHDRRARLAAHAGCRVWLEGLHHGKGWDVNDAWFQPANPKGPLHWIARRAPREAKGTFPPTNCLIQSLFP